METVRLGQTDLDVSAVVLGTWVLGGWAWGGADDKASIRAIHRALELGINFIDTAPVYGFGKAELIIGEALKSYRGSDRITIATKCGLEWDAKENIRRNSSPERIRHEAEESLRRLGIDCIDLYQIHWPDSNTPFETSMEAMMRLREEGKIRFIGLSNFKQEQIRECLQVGPVHTLQPPYNIFERESEKTLLPYCMEKGIATLVYGGLCRGLITGKFTGKETFPRGDLRRADPKFKPDRFMQYVKAVNALTKLAARYDKTTAQFALRWALQQPGVTTVIAGARTEEQVEDNVWTDGWSISDQDLHKVEEILQKKIKTPVGPDFFAPRE
ncbi:MAG: aldo/keto reductase [Syntrophobacteraceae bacterium]